MLPAPAGLVAEHVCGARLEVEHQRALVRVLHVRIRAEPHPRRRRERDADDEAEARHVAMPAELRPGPILGDVALRELVGRALVGAEPKPYVFTKCSQTWDKERRILRSLKADSVRRECEASLRRLGVEAIDLYQIHWPNPESEIEEGWQEMARLKEEGLVRHIGVSNFSVEQMRRLERIAPVESLQPPYSLLNRGIENEILPFCQKSGIGVIVYSPMASGLLTGAMTRARVASFPADDWRRISPNFQEPLLTRNLAFAARLKEFGARHGRSAGEVAIAWTLRHPAVTAAIVGGRSRLQVEGIVGAADFRLSPKAVLEVEGFLGRPA